MKPLAVGALAAAATALVGCTTHPDPHDAAMCMAVTAACPSTPPSYASEIEPIVQTHCAVCHFPGTSIAPTDLSTYDQVRRQGGTALSEIQSCLMPPPDAGQLSEADRTAFVEWLRCGAPNN